MKVNIKARNMDVTQALREYVEKRMAKFEKLTGVLEAQAAFTSIKERYRVEITITMNGVILRGEEENYDAYAAVDSIVDKLESQFHRYKSRLAKKGRGPAKDTALVNYVDVDTRDEDDVPVKVKHFPIKPMPVDEAIMQMNLLGHNFFVFLSAEDNQVNVVYKRKDGDYGLIMPEA